MLFYSNITAGNIAIWIMIISKGLICKFHHLCSKIADWVEKLKLIN